MLKKEAYLWANSAIQHEAKVLYVVLRNEADPQTWEISKPLSYLAKAISYKPALRSKNKSFDPTIKHVRKLLEHLESFNLVTKLTTGSYKKGDLPTYLLPMAICPLGHDKAMREGHEAFQSYQGLQLGEGHEETLRQGHDSDSDYRQGHEAFQSYQGLQPFAGHDSDTIEPRYDFEQREGHDEFEAQQGLQPGEGHSKYNNTINIKTCTDSDKSEPAPVEEIKKPAKVKKPKTVKFSDDDLIAAEWFKSQLEKSYLLITGKPYAKKINLETWADQIRLIRTIEKKDHAEICQLWKYARFTARDWYQGNILSPSSLRKYWDKLELEQAQQANKPTNQNTWSNKNEISNEISKQLTDPAYALTKW